MSDLWLYRCAGAAAMLGGALRVSTAFLEWNAENLLLELVALIIDLFVLFGLVVFYIYHRQSVGLVGFVATLFAAGGIASIVGPDAVAFGVDTYQVGVTVLSLGLAVLGGMLLATGDGLAKVIGVLWIGSLVSGVAGPTLGVSALGFQVGGVMFGVGFLFAGLNLVSRE